MVYDAVIVGASIAGLYTGMKLAQAGRKICIIDRKKEIGIPVRCGEATGNRLELSRFVEIDESWIACDLKGMKLHLNEKEPVAIEIKDAGVMLHRDRFENMLAQKAQESEADVLLNTSVMSLICNRHTFTGVKCNDGKEISGKIIIGADGCESKVGRWAGITESVPLKDAFPAIQYRITSDYCNDDYLHFFIGSLTIPYGYIWIFPKSSREISVGAGLYGCNNNSPKLKESLDAFIEKNIPSAERYNFVTGCIPSLVCPKKFVKDNVMVIGDAARQVNPLSAGGIMNTLEAADIAVKSLLKNNIKNYLRKWNQVQGRQQKIFYLLKEMYLDCSDKEVEKLIGMMKEDFQKYIDRSKPFTFPIAPFVRVFILFFPKFFKHFIYLIIKKR